MAQCEMTVEEMSDSLTGFDQIAIRKAFGSSLSDLSESDKLQIMYALAFVHRRREGDNEITAYNTAQSMTMGEIKGYFAEESVESGKDDSETKPMPKN